MPSRIARRTHRRDPLDYRSDPSTRALVSWLRTKYTGVRYNRTTQTGSADTGFLDIHFRETGNEAGTWVEIKIKPFKTDGHEAARVIDAITKVMRTV